MYEKIVLVGELRSGGTWIKSIFDPNHYIDLREFLSPLPQNGLTPEGYVSHVHAGHKLVDILVPILKYSNIDSRLISAIHDTLISIKIADNGEINTKFSNLETCLTYIETLKKLNKGSILKVLPLSLINNPKLLDLIKNSDLCIKFYRKNVLETYISQKKAVITGAWSHKESKQKNIDKTKIKIIWDIQDYMTYYHNMVKSYNYLFKNNEMEFQNCVSINYEDIHSNELTNQEKLDYIKNIIYQVNPEIVLGDNPILSEMIKENPQPSNIEDNFINPEDFIKNKNTTPFLI
jgi:hypothetical protein